MGYSSSSGLNLFCSTRIIDSPHTVDFTQGSPIGCGNYRTITEFPIFSVIWNDLHPHMMALPFALLAVGRGLRRAARSRGEHRSAAGHRAAPGAVRDHRRCAVPDQLLGLPDLPAAGPGALFIASHRAGTLTTRRAASIAALLPGSLIAYLPYYLTVHSYSKGIGLQASPSDMGQVLTVIGPLLGPAALYAIWRAVLATLPPLDGEASEGLLPDMWWVIRPRPVRAILRAVWPSARTALPKQEGPDETLPGWLYTAPPGWGYFAIGVAMLILVALPFRTDVLLLAIVALAVYALVRRMRLESPESLLGLGLAAGGALLLLISDYVYLQDIFAGGDSYRMNTVFKLYYQAWILLSIAAVYAVATIWRALRRTRPGLSIAWAVVAALLAGRHPGVPDPGHRQPGCLAGRRQRLRRPGVPARAGGGPAGVRRDHLDPE